MHICLSLWKKITDKSMFLSECTICKNNTARVNFVKTADVVFQAMPEIKVPVRMVTLHCRNEPLQKYFCVDVSIILIFHIKLINCNLH